MVSIKVTENINHSKTIILTSPWLRIIITIIDVFLIMGLSFLIFFFSLFQNIFDFIEIDIFSFIYSFVMLFILVLLPLNIVAFFSKIILTKDIPNKSIIFQKQFIIKRKPIIYRMDEKPYLKLVGSPLPWEKVSGIFALNIISDKQKDTMCPFFQQGWFVTKKQAVQISELLEIPVSKEIGKFKDFFTRL